MKRSVLLLEQDEELRSFWEEALSKQGFQVILVTNQAEALEKVKAEAPALIFLGSGLEGRKERGLLEELKALRSDILVIAPTDSGSLKEELRVIQAGGQKLGRDSFEINQMKYAIKNALEMQALEEGRDQWARMAREKYSFENFIGESSNIKEVLWTILQVIQSRSTTVLILGETGTGKEVVAKAIHYNSLRSKNPFLTVSCTAMPETLLETELFGHEAGAFTDARKMKRGLLETANGGTVFLDEIGDMKPALQAKLLNVLENRSFRHVGGTEDIHVDVRIIAATHKDLEALVREGSFREDLYYRLRVFPIHLAPLRERREDIIPLVKHFIDAFNKELNKNIKGLTFAAEKKLHEYFWPGNVRELRNVIERAMILAEGELILPKEIILEPKQETPSSASRMGSPSPEAPSLPETEKRLIEEALLKTKGNRTRAAKLLGISRFALLNRIKKFNLKEDISYR